MTFSHAFPTILLVVDLWATWANFQPKIKNVKKIHSKKSSYILSYKVFPLFLEIELSDSKIKNFLIFSQKTFLILQETELSRSKIKKNQEGTFPA